MIVPLVITYYQRGAPATGLPTRHGQGIWDSQYTAGHGEFPRIILALATYKNLLWSLAESVQPSREVPDAGYAAILLDKAMANCSQTYPVFDYGKFSKSNAGELLSGKRLWRQSSTSVPLHGKRVSPRVYAGTQKNGVHWHTGDAHNGELRKCRNVLNRKVNGWKTNEKARASCERKSLLKTTEGLPADASQKNLVVSWGIPKGRNHWS